MKIYQSKIVIVLFSILIILNFTNVIIINANSSKNISLIKADIIIPDDYDSINIAINSAKDGDIIFVRSGLYDENNFTINKKIILNGENPVDTIIRFNDTGKIINIFSDGAVISNFTIHKSNNSFSQKIEIYSNNCTINNNILDENIGIAFNNSSESKIINNNIKNSIIGIYLIKSLNNYIKNNKINNCSKGIYVEESKDNIIKNNEISNNEIGVFLSYSQNNQIIQNNFISNNEQSKFNTMISLLFKYKNIWKNNYWDDVFMFLPKIIPGLVYMKDTIFSGLFMPWYRFDWSPEKEPFVL